MPRYFYENSENKIGNEIKLLFCNLRPSPTSEFFVNHFVLLVKRKPGKKVFKA